MLRRLVSLLLCAVLVLGLCACTPANEESGPVFQVGFGRESITPTNPVPMGGYGRSNNRISEGVAYDLFGTCIAFTYGEEKVLLFTQDLLNSIWQDEVRIEISNATGVQPDRILICATHTHFGPDIGNTDTRISLYKELYMSAMVKAATDALADCAPATLYSGKTKTDGLNFVRHYLMADGSYAGDNFGDFSASSIAGHATEGDPEMIVVKADREGDKKDIAIVNWQAHPCASEGGSANKIISADFIGPMRTTFESSSGMLFAYFTGAAGNQNTTTQIAEEKNHLSVDQLGQKLANIAYSVMDSVEKIEGPVDIRSANEIHEYALNHDKEDKLIQAMEVAALWQGGATLSAANALAHQYGFSSVFEADAVRYRPNRAAKASYEINALYVGGLAFVTAPYEMFSDPAVHIKEESPFDTTMVFTCANGRNLYFATEAAYEYGSYEAVTSMFAKGCAEDSAEALLKLLNSLK